jgi:hypothetical protein
MPRKSPWQTLPQQHAVTVIRSTRRQQPLPQHLEQVIIDKAQGNPFFLEELTRAVLEHGGTAIEVPDTIQGVLSARIDRLPDAAKRLLQTASVLGREFAPTLLKEMWERSDTFPALQDHFGQSGQQLPGCGFPIAHLLAFFHAGTGMGLHLLAAPLRTHDLSEVVRLHPELRSGDVLVADRGFCSYAHLALLVHAGVHAVCRMP